MKNAVQEFLEINKNLKMTSMSLERKFGHNIYAVFTGRIRLSEDELLCDLQVYVFRKDNNEFLESSEVTLSRYCLQYWNEIGEYKIGEVVKQEEATVKRCDCESFELLNFGCKCGGV